MSGSAGPSGAGGRPDLHIDVPQFHGLEPNLALSYDAGRGNGWLGVGWSLGGVATIVRQGAGGGVPAYTASDQFFLNGQELVACMPAVSSPGCRHMSPGATPKVIGYRLEGDSSVRVEWDTSTPLGVWRVWTATGVVSVFLPRGGLTGGQPTASWHLSQRSDPLGSAVTYDYATDADPDGLGDQYLQRITYNGTLITFFSEQRPDVSTQATGRGLIVTSKRLRSIDVTVGGQRLRAYELSYTTRDTTSRSLLTRVRQFGRDAILNAAGQVIDGTAMPALTFDPQPGDVVGSWQPTAPRSDSFPAWSDDVAPSVFNGLQMPSQLSRTSFSSGDVDGDGRADFVKVSPSRLSGGPALLQITVGLAGRPGGTGIVDRILAWPEPDGFRFRWLGSWVADLNADGAEDLILAVENRVQPSFICNPLHYQCEFAKLSLYSAMSRRDGTFDLLATPSETWWNDDAQHAEWRIDCQPGDADGDGRVDLMCVYPERGSPNATGKSIQTTVAAGTAFSRGDGTFALVSTTLPNLAPHNDIPQLTVADSDGDGRSDLLLNYVAQCRQNGYGQPVDYPPGCGKNTFVIAVSRGNGGYATTEYPTAFAGYGTLYGADINGDGRADVLRIVQDPRPIPVGGANDGDFYVQSLLSQPDGAYRASEQTVPFLLLDPDPNSPGRQSTWTVGDVNGDGASDLLVISRQDAHPASGCLAAYAQPHVAFTRVLSNRDGTFRWPSTLLECGQSRERNLPWDASLQRNGIRAPDVNGDGLADGFGAFGGTNQQPLLQVVDDVSPATGADGFRALNIDVTGDGRQDVVYLRSYGVGATVFTWKQRSDGSYTPKVRHALGSHTHPVLAAWNALDADGDGRTDLVHVDRDANGSIVTATLLAIGDGDWKENVRPAWPGYTTQFPDDSGVDGLRWRPADVNGDGRTDLVHLRRAGAWMQINTLLADGGGGWTPVAATAVAGSTDAGDLSDTLNWQPADVNGDGRTDLVHVEHRRPIARVFTLLSAGDGLTWRPGAGPSPQLLTGAPRNWRSVEANGDGQTDLVHVSTDGKKLTVSTLLAAGDGSWLTKSSAVTLTVPAGTALSFADTARWRTADVNGDHRTDLVHVAPLHPGLRVDTLMSTGDGMWVPKTPKSDAWPGYAQPGPPTWIGSDVDGDGRDDIVRVDSLAGSLRISVLRSTVALDLTTGTDNGTGLRTTITYEPSRDGINVYARTGAVGCHLPVGVVLQLPVGIRQQIAGAQAEVRAVTYRCGRWSSAKRRLLGWTGVWTRTYPAGNRPASTLVSQFTLGDVCPSQLAESRIQDDDGQVYTRTVIGHPPPDPTDATSCLPERVTVEQRNGGSLTQQTTTTMRYDEFGNARQVAELGDPDDPGDDRVRNRTFNPALDQWIVSLPASEDLRDGVDQTARGYRRTVWCYDGDNGRPVANCPGRPARGLLTAVKQLHDDGKYRTTTYGYDAFGNNTSITDARNNTTTTTYDPVRHIYPESICNALRQCSTAEWNRNQGVVEALVDPNKARTEMTTTVHGWPQTVSPPGGGRIELSYLDWDDPARRRVVQRVNDGSADGLWSETWLDGLDRPHLTVREGDRPGRTYVRYVLYTDASARPAAQSNWRALPSGVSPAWERFDYDILGRQVLQTHADGSMRAWVYSNDATRTWVKQISERGTIKLMGSDAHRRFAEVREYNNAVVSWLRYSYDAADQVESITDDQGNVTRRGYDNLGRLISADDPDRGRWSWTWDAAGNLETQTDARGNTLVYAYDEINRPVTRAYEKGGFAQATWRYDEPGHGAAVGQLTSVSDRTGWGCPAQQSRSLDYDTLGRVSADTRCVDGDARTMRFAYDALGRWETVTYPGGDQRQYGYDSAGRLRDITGLVGEYTYDADGNLASAERADSTFTVWQRDAQRRWLDRVSTTSPVSGALLDLTYTYEPDGLLRSGTTVPGGPTLSYRYDGLDRLTDVTGGLTQHFSWDSIGNLRHSSAVGAFTYPGPGPHAAASAGNEAYRYDANGNTTHIETRTTSIATSPAEYTVRRGDTLWSIAASELGNARSWPQVWRLNRGRSYPRPPGGRFRNPDRIYPGQVLRLPQRSVQVDVTQVRRLEWNHENQLSAIIDPQGQPITFRYDADGQRVEKRQGTSVVHYFGRWLESSGRGTPDTRYYWAGNQLVARRVASGLQFYHLDSLGSTRMLTGGNGTVLARYGYQPFGNAETHTGQATTDLQFTGLRQDGESRLIFAGARYYDPTRARFLSPDSAVPDLTATQAANTYLYAYANPTRWTDPTGHSPECSNDNCVFDDDVIEAEPLSVARATCLFCSFQLGELQFAPPTMLRPTDRGVGSPSPSSEWRMPATDPTDPGATADELIAKYGETVVVGASPSCDSSCQLAQGTLLHLGFEGAGLDPSLDTGPRATTGLDVLFSAYLIVSLSVATGGLLLGGGPTLGISGSPLLAVSAGDAAVLSAAASVARGIGGAPSFLGDLGALAQSTAQLIPGGQVHLLGAIGSSPVYGSLVSGVGIASINGVTMIVRMTNGVGTVLGPFR